MSRLRMSTASAAGASTMATSSPSPPSRSTSVPRAARDSAAMLSAAAPMIMRYQAPRPGRTRQTGTNHDTYGWLRPRLLQKGRDGASDVCHQPDRRQEDVCEARERDEERGRDRAERPPDEHDRRWGEAD